MKDRVSLRRKICRLIFYGRINTNSKFFFKVYEHRGYYKGVWGV